MRFHLWAAVLELIKTAQGHHGMRHNDLGALRASVCSFRPQSLPRELR